MSSFGTSVTAPSDASFAAWIMSRLGQFGTVGGLVPRGFEEYLLVRHVQPGERPSLDDSVQLVAALASLAERHTTTPDLVWYAIWEGYGWASASTLYAVRGGSPLAWLKGAWVQRQRRASDRRRAEEVRQRLAEVPRFDLPERRYFLVSGPLEAASRIASPDGFGLQVSDLWWPDDRRWFVATDTDLDWTYIGGTAALVTDIATAFPDHHELVQLSDENASFFQPS